MLQMTTHKILTPMNQHTAALIRFVPHFRELIVNWTACSVRSEGVERFVEEYLPEIR